MPFPQFDRSRLQILPLAERTHDLTLEKIVNVPNGPRVPFAHKAIPILAERIVQAAAEKRAVLFACGRTCCGKGTRPCSST